MPLALHHIVIDSQDLPAQARFWSEALMPSPDPKSVKNRVHLDLTTGADDRDEEIDRLLSLGARRVDAGQTGEETWEVLADPEGNEFCVVRPKAALVR